MRYITSKQFEKDFKKLAPILRQKVIERIEIFVENQHDIRLRVHALKGEWCGYYSIDITGDVRAVHFYLEAEIVQFVAIGTHSQLYK